MGISFSDTICEDFAILNWNKTVYFLIQIDSKQQDNSS